MGHKYESESESRSILQVPLKTPCPVDDAILKQMVDAYIRDRKKGRLRYRRDMEALRKLPRLEVAILNVRYSPVNGKRYDHQWSITDEISREAESKLQAAKEEIRTAKDFDELHAIVQREVGGLWGVGDLVVYDFALRIGAFLRKEPKLVYLHAGTAKGARLLRFAGKTVDPNELPEAFSPLTPAEIEDFLCVYKSQLAAAVKSNS